MEAQGCAFGRKPENTVFVVAADPSARLETMSLVRNLRMNRISADMDYMAKSMKSQMKSAGSMAQYACILGSDEIAKGIVTVKNLADGTQEELTEEQLINKLG